MTRWNLPVTPVRSEIERIWEAMDQRDDWSLLKGWLERIRVPMGQPGGSQAFHDQARLWFA